MFRKIISRLAPMAIALSVYGCASNDGGPTSENPDDLTPEEAAEGAAWSAQNGPDQAHAEDGLGPDAHVDDGQKLTTPLEDSKPFLDPDDDANVLDTDGLPVPQLDPKEITELTKCQRATGYRNGKAMTICVTTIDGKLVEVNTARAYLKMRAAASKRGVRLYVVSGFRTMAQQRYLYNCYKTKRCNGGNLAAPPGYSNHQSGHALDLNTSARGVYSFLANHGKTYRFKRTVPSEAWHWEHW